MNDKRVSPIRIGFMPLTDCAPLVVADRLGFFRQQGLEVILEKQNSWATLRDKLLAGYLDMAQMLAPMPLAMHIGIGNKAEPMRVPMVLSFNGNGITLSRTLFDEVIAHQDTPAEHVLTGPLQADCLRPIIEQRRASGAPKLCFATVFPYSCHYYQLLFWLQQGGIKPDDVEIRIIPPASMVRSLTAGEIDGFCIGSPWNAAAVRAEVGVTVIASAEIWHNSPEKVLGTTVAWAQRHPERLERVVTALEQACQWLSVIPNRFEAACWLVESQFVGATLESVVPALLDSCLTMPGMQPREIAGHSLFQVPQSQNRVSVEQAIWLLQQMQRAQQLPVDLDLAQTAQQIFGSPG